jgi:two-component system, OmpR family, manganese sensing sensor histidine kinase
MICCFWRVKIVEVTEEQKLAAQARGIQLQLEIADAPEFNVAGDWNQLARLFTNLIDNAIQYTPAHQQPVPKIVISLASNAPSIQVVVQDQGMGIGATDLPRLLNRFYRVNAARSGERSGGSGLGLSIVQSIVQRHQGELAISSELGQGTRVTMTLPITYLKSI